MSPARRRLLLYALGALLIGVELLGARWAEERIAALVPAEEPAEETPPSRPEPTPQTALVVLPSPRRPAWVDLPDRASLLTALERNVRWLAARDPARELVYGPRTVTVGEVLRAQRALLSRLAADPSRDVGSLVDELFEPLEAAGGNDGRMLVTGYFEAVIDGSLRPRPDYPVPIYGPPPGTIKVDLGDFDPALAGKKILGRLDGARLVPLPPRKEVRESKPYRGREIAWARDPVDLFFLEVQGSGALRLPDGGEVRIGYAGANGRIYRSIGKLLIDEGHLERAQVSMQSIRAWLAEHPEERERVLDYNESVVFFRRLEGSPLGNLGFPVTPERSVAVDQSMLPPAALGYLLTSLPGEPNGPRRAVRGFVLAQDTGGAIRGPGRVDVFWGRGEAASASAGVMKERGRLFLFVPRAGASPGG